MRKNANLKSKEEAMKRMINGEVFFYCGYELYFDVKWSYPFVCKNPAGYVEKINAYWDFLYNWEIAGEWYENLGEGVLCWVWDEDKSYRKLALIEAYRHDFDYKFKVYDGFYKNAEPAAREEVEKYIYKQD